jgi:hypothetical protein
VRNCEARWREHHLHVRRVPDPDPYVFGPPGSASGSVGHKYRSGSGSLPFPIKVLRGLKKYKNFLTKNSILIIKHICKILKLLKFMD